jgi:hypothetical protein
MNIVKSHVGRRSTVPSLAIAQALSKNRFSWYHSVQLGLLGNVLVRSLSTGYDRVF